MSELNLASVKGYTTAQLVALPYKHNNMLAFDTTLGRMVYYIKTGDIWADMTGVTDFYALSNIHSTMAPTNGEFLHFDQSLNTGLGEWTKTKLFSDPALATSADCPIMLEMVGGFPIVKINPYYAFIKDAGDQTSADLFQGAYTLPAKVLKALETFICSDVMVKGMARIQKLEINEVVELIMTADTGHKIDSFQKIMVRGAELDTKLPTAKAVMDYVEANGNIKPWVLSTAYKAGDVKRYNGKLYVKKIDGNSGATFTIGLWDKLSHDTLQEAYDNEVLANRALLNVVDDGTNGGLFVRGGAITGNVSIFKVAGGGSTLFKVAEDNIYCLATNFQTNNLIFSGDTGTAVTKIDKVIPAVPLNTSFPTTKLVVENMHNILDYNDVATTYVKDQQVVQDGAIYRLIGPTSLTTSSAGFSSSLWLKLGGSGGLPNFVALKSYKQFDSIALNNTAYRATVDFVAGATFLDSDWERINGASSIGDFVGTHLFYANDVIFHIGKIFRAKVKFTSGATFLITDWETIAVANPFEEIQPSTFYKAGTSTFVTEIRHVFDSDFTTLSTLDVSLDVDIPWSSMHEANKGTMQVSGSKLVEKFELTSNMTAAGNVKVFSVIAGKKYFIKGQAYIQNVTSGEYGFIRTYNESVLVGSSSLDVDSNATVALTHDTFEFTATSSTIEVTYGLSGTVTLNAGSVGSRYTWFEIYEVTSIVGTILREEEFENEHSAFVSVTGTSADTWLVPSNSSPGVFPITFAGLGLTEIPDISLDVDAPNGNIVISYGFLTTTSVTVYTSVATSGGLSSLPFHIKIKKRGADKNLFKNAVVILPSIKIAYLKDKKGNTAPSGTFSSGAYRTRDLNNLTGDSSFVTLSSNQFTLEAGTYDIEGSAPASGSGGAIKSHKVKIRNISDSSDALIGTAENHNILTGSGQTRSFIFGQIVITSSKTFEVQHRCSASGAFGIGAGFGDSEVYAQIKITKIKK